MLSRKLVTGLESLGIDVFQDTGICFCYENELGDSENLKLPGNYNRNIMMIFKEAMSNCSETCTSTSCKIKNSKNRSPRNRDCALR